jgi:hypothetical protein
MGYQSEAGFQTVVRKNYTWLKGSEVRKHDRQTTKFKKGQDEQPYSATWRA